jgi:hypothetical protein
VEIRGQETQQKPDGFVDSEPIENDVNDSLWTVITADTMDTDPEDETESRDREGVRRAGGYGHPHPSKFLATAHNGLGILRSSCGAVN